MPQKNNGRRRWTFWQKRRVGEIRRLVLLRVGTQHSDDRNQKRKKTAKTVGSWTSEMTERDW